MGDKQQQQRQTQFLLIRRRRLLLLLHFYSFNRQNSCAQSFVWRMATMKFTRISFPLHCSRTRVRQRERGGRMNEKDREKGKERGRENGGGREVTISIPRVPLSSTMYRTYFEWMRMCASSAYKECRRRHLRHYHSKVSIKQVNELRLQNTIILITNATHCQRRRSFCLFLLLLFYQIEFDKWKRQRQRQRKNLSLVPKCIHFNPIVKTCECAGRVKTTTVKI